MDINGLDVVYFVKEYPRNEELRFSLRSLKNLKGIKRVWFFGGCPKGIAPDIRVRVFQEGNTKWDKVHNMFRMACENKEITDNFILFNDDFFVMRPTDKIEPTYRCGLDEYIRTIESRNHNRPNEYSKLLRGCRDDLKRIGATQLCYELHTPFIFNKKKLSRLLDKFPNRHCTRTLYGNIYHIEGRKANDVKIFSIKPNFDYKTSQFLSTEDSIVNVNNDIWRWLKRNFPEKSHYEE